jgi:hypothetical protein
MHTFIDFNALMVRIRGSERPEIDDGAQEVDWIEKCLSEAPKLSPDDVRGVGCPVCQCEEPLPEDAMTHEFYIRGSMLWYYDQLFGWEGKRVAFCPFCGKRLRMKGVSEDA